MHDLKIVLRVSFFRQPSGKEPVKEWLYELEKKDRKIIGVDIKLVQYGWPVGMPVVAPLSKGLQEIRSTLDNRIARIIFTLYSGRIILLHGFIKKSPKTPASDLELAQKRAKNLNRRDYEKE